MEAGWKWIFLFIILSAIIIVPGWLIIDNIYKEWPINPKVEPERAWESNASALSCSLPKYNYYDKFLTTNGRAKCNLTIKYEELHPKGPYLDRIFILIKNPYHSHERYAHCSNRSCSLNNFNLLPENVTELIPQTIYVFAHKFSDNSESDSKIAEFNMYYRRYTPKEAERKNYEYRSLLLLLFTLGIFSMSTLVRNIKYYFEK